MADDFTVNVYTRQTKGGGNTNAAFSFTVDTSDQVSDHIRQIYEKGYYRIISADNIEWYPPHEVIRVEANGPNLSLGYTDTDISA